MVQSGFSYAVVIEDLYVAEVFVTSQSSGQLNSGARAGLTQVLIRVSGANMLQQNPVIARALRKPGDYYYQYSYQATDREFQIGDQLVAARILRLRFEPSAIAQLLRSAGYPVWGSNRPSILLWLALSDEGGRRILTESDTSELGIALSNQAKLRGLPFLYPLFDLEDELLTAEIWGAFLERIEGASTRYNPDAILTARIQKNKAGQWTGSWSYQIDQQWYEFSSLAVSVEELVLDLTDILVDKLAAKYAIDSSRNLIDFRVENITSLEDYAAVSNYLQSLTPVLDTFVTEIDGDNVLFSLKTEGRIEQLIEIIGLDESLVLMNNSLQSQKLHYRWLPKDGN